MILLVVIVAVGFGAVQFMGDEAGDSPSGGLAFMPIDPLFAPVVREREFRGYVLLSLQLELADSSNAETVTLHMAPLRGAPSSAIFTSRPCFAATASPVSIFTG